MSPTPSSRSVAFTEAGVTGQAAHDSGPTLVVGTSDASRRVITRLFASVTIPADRVPIAVFQGEQRTGGYGVHVTAIERHGDQLVVRATFTEPKPDAMVTQALTSPAHIVTIAAADAVGLREAILIDGSGAQRARINTT